ncbi:hypothetical protein NE236_38890 [Actinoallomurus purpureus]|uniref:hypothetical protein n=1 Tax=Actinoallomurus purpureus TaxID=478114 RepID=UPI002092284D|nr:hypothetical protein [Actinoallomurus purpureus]MCO6010942.1 hypothetical protein [Actinoallomurus purpureus]
MSVVAEWSERIARRVTPEEIDFAADVGEAFAAGGVSRRALFDSPGAEPGGFGLASAVGELPVILAALADTGRVLRHALGTQEFGNVMAVASLLVSLRGGGRPPDEQRDDARTALARAYVELRDRLQTLGFPPGRAERLARELLEELLTDAVSAEDFLRRLDGGKR